MKIPQSFFNALAELLSKGDKRAERLEKALSENPKKAAEFVANELGTSTRPIKLS
jgi:hypothetical protein